MPTSLNNSLPFYPQSFKMPLGTLLPSSLKPLHTCAMANRIERGIACVTTATFDHWTSELNIVHCVIEDDDLLRDRNEWTYSTLLELLS